jgi:SET domain-containing protein
MLIPRRSSIQGSGIFTDAPLRARKKIGEYTGERISVREARRRARTRKKIAIIEVSDYVAIDESVGGGPFQFINHSCDPNVYIRIAYGRAEFYALRNIRAGEELTCDYGESHHEGTLPCRCGAKNCQKFI